MNPIFPSRYVVVSTQPFYITGPNQIIECNGFAYDPRTTFTTSDLFAGYSYENVGALLSNFQCQEPEAIRRQRQQQQQQQQQQEQELHDDNNGDQGDQDNLNSHRCESPEMPISIDKPFYRRESAFFDKKRTRGRPRDEVKARTFYCCMNPNCLIRKDAEKKIVDGKVRYSIRSKNIKNIRRHPCVKNMMIGDGMALADLVNYLIKEGYVKKCVDPPGEYSDNECGNDYISSNNFNNIINNNNNINNNISNDNDSIDRSISGSDGAIIIDDDDDDDDDENGDGDANSKGDEQTKSMEVQENGNVDGDVMDVENDVASHVPDTQGCASSTVSGNSVIVIDKNGNVVENNNNEVSNNENVVNENNNNNNNEVNNDLNNNNNEINNEKVNQQQEKEKEKEKENQNKYQERTVIKYEIKEGNYCFDFGKDQNFNINSMIFGAINLPSLPMCDLDVDKSDKTRNKTGTKCPPPPPPPTAIPVKLNKNNNDIK